jgi:hypothetical protein
VGRPSENHSELAQHEPTTDCRGGHFEELALPHIRAKRLKRVLASFSSTFPGFYRYYPSSRNLPSKLKALIEYLSRREA